MVYFTYFPKYKSKFYFTPEDSTEREYAITRTSEINTYIAKAACMQQLAVMPRSGNGICLIVCSFALDPSVTLVSSFFLDGDFI